MPTIFYFILGLILLIFGAEGLVRGAANLAARLKIPPLVIGLTVVAFGTSAPELAVSIQSALMQQPDVSLGNVIGSNIFNVLLILGLSAMIVPLTVARQLIRLDVPIMIVVSILAFLLSINGTISRWEGLILIGCLMCYTLFLFIQGAKEKQKSLPGVESDRIGGKFSMLRDLLLVSVGLGMLLLGSNWLVNSATSIARSLGISELVIGLTLVAGGTSLPEVATSVLAAVRKQRDIAVGNVIGSNIFNLLGVAGFAAFIAPSGLGVSQAALHFDFPILLAVSLACLPIFFTGREISRWEGAMFFFYYLAYVFYLFIKTTEHDSLPWFNWIMLYFVIPITVVTFIVITFRTNRKKSRRQTWKSKSTPKRP